MISTISLGINIPYRVSHTVISPIAGYAFIKTIHTILPIDKNKHQSILLQLKYDFIVCDWMQNDKIFFVAILNIFYCKNCEPTKVVERFFHLLRNTRTLSG